VEKSWNLTLVRKIRETQGNCGLNVVCHCSCDSYKITRGLLSKVDNDMHKMDCMVEFSNIVVIPIQHCEINFITLTALV